MEVPRATQSIVIFEKRQSRPKKQKPRMVLLKKKSTDAVRDSKSAMMPWMPKEVEMIIE